ncbi:helix-turn-helix transcriptional regulator [Rubrivirga sp.]|uniref:helix-turn-helix transcriptional regulator n=1 Tax=Rubrivirga sp. TaxID=1885344 RepID=UPI003B524181
MTDPVRRALALLDHESASFAGPEDVARAVGLLPETLRRQFKREVGIPLGEYLTQRRVAEAQRLLEETDLQAAEVGRAVGWRREDTAARVFRRETGTTMQGYRRSVREGRGDG